MDIVLLIAIILCSIGAKVADSGKFYDDHMSRENTLSLKGLFIIAVFFWQFAGMRFMGSGSGSDIFAAFVSRLGPYIAGIYLFISGFGIMECIKQKKTDYVAHIPRHRFAKIFLQFIAAVLLYYLVSVMNGHPPKADTMLLSLVALDSFGNPYWFVFELLVCYLAVYISFMIIRKNNGFAILLSCAIALAVMILMRHAKPDQIISTIPCFMLGMWYSYLKKGIYDYITQNAFSYLAFLLAALVIYIIIGFRRDKNVWYYAIWALSFTCIAVMITMKVRLGNGILKFLGTHAFAIYLLQGLAVTYMRPRFDVCEHRYLFFTLSALVTVFAAYIFDWVVGKIDKAYFDRIKRKKQNDEYQY